MSPLAPKRSLVTGGAGFIGSHLVEALLERGHEVVVIDDLSTGRRENLVEALHHGARLHEGDLRDAERVAEVVAEANPQRIFHLAAQADVRKAVVDPNWDAEVNVIGTINVLEAASRLDGAGVVFAATGGAVYGEGAGMNLPLDESTPAAPETPYGASKLAGEVYVGLYRRLHRVPGVALRFANVYGPRQDPHGEAGVVAIFCGCILDGSQPTVFGDGLQTRDFVYVVDVVEAILAAGEELDRRGTDLEGPINVGTSLEASVLDLVELLGQAAGKEIEVEHAPARAGEVQRIAIDPALAEAELGWSPETDLRVGLERTLRWISVDRGKDLPVPSDGGDALGSEPGKEADGVRDGRITETSSPGAFSAALTEHLECSGELDLVEGGGAGVAALVCSGCGTTILHRGGTLDPDLLRSPPGASASALMLAVSRSRMAELEEGDESSPRGKVVAYPATEIGGRDADDDWERRSRTEAGAESVTGSRREGHMPAATDGRSRIRASLDQLADRFERRVLFYVLVALPVLAPVVITIALLAGDDPDPSSLERRQRQTFGPITASIPTGWSASSRTPEEFEAQFESPGGEASVFVATADDRAETKQLVAEASELLVGLHDNVVIESERGGDRPGVTASYDDGTLEAVIRNVRGVDLISVADVSAGAPPGVAAQASAVAGRVEPAR